MNEKIKTLSDQIYEDIQNLRESSNYDVEKRLGVEIMALNALCNAIKTSTFILHKPVTAKVDLGMEMNGNEKR